MNKINLVNPRIDQKHINEFCLRWSINPSTLSFLGGLENQVYSFKKNKNDYILRVGHSNHMTHDLVQAEMDWVCYLYEKNIPVPKPLSSKNSILVEKVPAEIGYFNVIALEKLPGNHINFLKPWAWSEEIIYQWGKILGKMHTLSKEYTPKNVRRYDFKLTSSIVEEMISNEPKPIKKKIIDIFQSLESLPKTKDAYGLVHSDLHPGNFLTDDNVITGILDFDRTCYKWFISEIAIALYYPLYLSPLNTNKNEQEDFLHYFFPIFWKGYRSETFLDPFWLSTLNTFIQVRDAILFLYLPRKRARNDLNRIKDRLLSENAYIDIKVL